MSIIYENLNPLPAARLLFQSSVALIAHELVGYLRITLEPGQHPSAELRAMFVESWRLHQAAGLHRVLFDQRLAVPFSEADKMWFIESFTPRLARQNAATRFAHLTATNVFARLSMVPMAAGIYHQGDSYKSFEEEAAALQWLLR
ncbi:MAG: hypothetical protein ACRYFX_07990 [Janthinobacterium lividum]